MCVNLRRFLAANALTEVFVPKSDVLGLEISFNQEQTCVNVMRRGRSKWRKHTFFSASQLEDGLDLSGLLLTIMLEPSR